MRDLSLGRVAPMASVLSLIAAVTGPAAAQAPAAPSAAPTAPAVAPAPAPVPAPAPAPAVAPAPAPMAAPPPGYMYAPPPPGYAYAYPAPPGYMYAAPTRLRPPESVPYNGGPVPPGYHVEEHVRRGLVIGGAITLGVPWVLGVTIASGYDFSNQSGWLVVPALGPWLTLATRDTEKNCSVYTQVVTCSQDNSVRTMLVLDGLTQAAGTFMLLYGLSSTKKVIARDFVGSLHFTPAPMGKLGYGGLLSGEF
ncbi:MAG TPA: hypothetical protein VER12_11640 [Polyangiaceae bacterium]|nr:hypothetical protein [Polyangiaceae bacterium]